MRVQINERCNIDRVGLFLSSRKCVKHVVKLGEFDVFGAL
jgi:hypothetical protein